MLSALTVAALALAGCTAASTVSDAGDQAPGGAGEQSEPISVPSACEDDWLRQLSMDGVFEVTARGDLEGATSLPAVGEAGEVQFVTPAICVVDIDLLDLGIARSYIFAGGLPFGLAENFEAAGWDGYFGYESGYAYGAYKPTTAADTLAYAQLSDSFHDAGSGTGTMPSDHYRLNLTPSLVEELGG